MRLEGSLDAFTLPDIFSLLSMTTKTGGLHLRRGDVQGVVWFAAGALTGGVSDAGTQSLGRRIAGSGHVDDAALAAAVERVAGDAGLGVARALLDAAAIDQDSLRGLVSEHVADTVFGLMRWPDGDFEFVVDEPNPDYVGVARAVDEVVEEVRQRLESWPSVAERVPSPDTVLTMVLAPEEDPRLSREEWALLALVDGRRTVAQLVALCGRGEYAVVGALAELVSRGLVRVNDPEDVMALVRRQELLHRLESAAPVVALSAQDATPETDVETAGPDVANAAAPDAVPAEEAPTQVDFDVAAEADDDDRPVADVTPMKRNTAAARSRDAVRAQRPETTLPAEPQHLEQPEQPEQPVPAAMSAVAGGAVATPAAVPGQLIERDPSVNKSLLLRLIAGVRGL